MSEKPFDITRRKILGSLGVIGVGAALGGAGTAAFFSDEETFKNNRLAAGSFDLLVDWQEEYNGEMVDAFPDYEPDGEQNGPYSFSTVVTNPELVGLSNGATEQDLRDAYRDQFADLPEALADRPPLIDLEDVKPGDSGEVTFSMHLFDVPGYLWMTGSLVEAAENGLTEPEAADPDETEDVVELLDAVQVLVWYDDGDNRFEDPEFIALGGEDILTLSGGQQVVTEGSLRAVLTDLSSGVGIPLDADPTTEARDCFTPAIERYVGFAWTLPPDHANEVQTDSATFDLGFYAEQCANNDGLGMQESLVATVGEGDYSQTSYDRKLGMALRYGNSHYEDGSIGRPPYEQEIHPSTAGYGQHFAFESGTTYTFEATLSPGSATELAVFGDGLGRSVGDSDLATGSYTVDATGGPTEGELALTVKAQSAALSAGDSVTIENVTVNGIPVTPASLTATKGGTELRYMALAGLDFTTDVTLRGSVTFDVDETALPATDPHSVMTALGIDWR